MIPRRCQWCEYKEGYKNSRLNIDELLKPVEIMLNNALASRKLS